MISEFPDYCSKPILILGCGNVLFGDDGFGPEVLEYFFKNGFDDHRICFLNTGTSVRKVLFNIILSEKRPQKIIIIDSMDGGNKPGTVSKLPIDAIPFNKIDDFSMHQIPTSNLLRELKKSCGIEVEIIAFQPVEIPSEVAPGLSQPAKEAIKPTAELILRECFPVPGCKGDLQIALTGNPKMEKDDDTFGNG